MIRILILLCLLLLPAEVLGADYYVRVGGIRLSGASKSGDWSLSNCYSTITKALGAMDSKSTDRLFLYNEFHTLSNENDLSCYTANQNNDTDYSECVVTFSPKTQLNVKGSVGTAYTIKGITFMNHPAGDGYGVLRVSNASDSDISVTINSCAFIDNLGKTGQDIDMDGSAINLVNNASSPVTLNVIDSYFKGNQARRKGAAIGIKDSATVLISGCVFTQNQSESGQLHGSGAAIYAYSPNSRSRIDVFDSTFTYNKSTNQGGAVHILAANSSFTNCIFSHNEANYGHDNRFSSGGAIRVGKKVKDGTNITSTFSGCIFDHNRGWSDGGYIGTVGGDGGAIQFWGSGQNDKVEGYVYDCDFRYNFATQGGAVYYGRYSIGRVERCLFFKNTAFNNGGASSRGGVPPDTLGETTHYEYCAFISNKAGYDAYEDLEGQGEPCYGTGHGGAINSRLYGRFEAINCSFLDNYVSGTAQRGDSIVHRDAGGSFDSDQKRSVIRNCVFYGTGTGYEIEGDANAYSLVDYCAYEPGEVNAPGSTPSNTVSLASNPYRSLSNARLHFSSPCIDSGYNSLWDSIPNITDLDGNSITDAEGNIVAPGGTVDIGAYEFTSLICEGDSDQDGDVDGGDLAIFAADFGRTDCASENTCEGDFDTDGDVDGSDLAVFAAEYGRSDCPIPQS